MKDFFLIGPLRTGSSLLARCLDDHPAVICLCESEINRTLFCSYSYRLHFNRMIHHGLNFQEIAGFLTNKRQNDIGSLERWYDQVFADLRVRYGKSDVRARGDKSPDFFMEPSLVEWLKTGDKRLIYTVRDPRAIFSSILNGPGRKEEVDTRWDLFRQNFQIWKPYLNSESLLVVKYEELLLKPKQVMTEVYAHLDLEYTDHFLQNFERLFPSRFLWKSNTDWESGVAKQFDCSKIEKWKTQLTEKQKSRIGEDEIVADFMRRFSYPF